MTPSRLRARTTSGAATRTAPTPAEQRDRDRVVEGVAPAEEAVGGDGVEPVMGPPQRAGDAAAGGAGP